MRKIVYDRARQRARLRHVLESFVKVVGGFSFSPASEEGESVHADLSFILVLEMTDWACTVKHNAFASEREWRIITYPLTSSFLGWGRENYKGVSVRPTPRLLLPYMVLKAGRRKRLPVVEIRCGPSQFQEQSGRALNILLHKHGYHIPINFSEVPLRA